MIEKPFFIKLNKIADWIIRIVVLNIFMVILSLPIITSYVAFKVGYEMFADYTEGKHTPLFKGIWNNLKKDFWRNLGIGALIIVLLIIGLFSSWQYNQLLNAEENWFNLIGYSITLIFTLTIFILSIYSLTISFVFDDLTLKNLFKLSLYSAGKYFLRSILVLGLTIAPFLLFLVPSLVPIFVLGGLSLPLLLNVLLMKKPVRFLKGEERNV